MSNTLTHENLLDYDQSLLRPPEHPDAFAGRHKFAYLALIAVAVVMALIIYTLSRGTSWEGATAAGVLFGLAVMAVHAIHRLWSRPRNFLSPDLFYLLFYAMFHLSYLALWLLGIVETARNVFPMPHQYPLVMLIVNLAILGFLFGYELAAPRRSLAPTSSVRRVPTVLWVVAGLALMILALIIHLAYIFTVGLRTWVLYGYEVYARMERFVQYPRLWRVQFHIFSLGFGVYITSVALRHRRLFKGKLGISLFLFYLFLLVMEGGRTHLVTTGMILLLVRHFVIKPVKLRWLIILGLCALVAFTAIKLTRRTAAFNVPGMVDVLRRAQTAEETHWYDPLVEMGSTVGTVNLTTMVVPRHQPYWYGRSYVQAITHVVPYLSGALVPYLGASPSSWLTYTHYGAGATSGTGFSIAAEGYLNFGLLGVFFHMAVIGLILRWIYARFARSMSAAGTLVFIVAYGLFMITVRNHVNLLVSPLVRVVVLAWLLKSICREEPAAEIESPEPASYEQPEALPFGPEDVSYQGA